MKKFITFILILTVHFSFGQNTYRFLEIIPNGFYGKITRHQTIVHSGKLDFDFYRKYFSVPYYYPHKLTDKRYKNDTITVWNDATKKDDLFSNWKYRIVYDSLSRVTSYRYSACVVCSQLPYDYHFYYNQKGQVTKMVNKLNDDKSILFEYDTDGNIIKIEVYDFSKLTKRVSLIRD